MSYLHTMHTMHIVQMYEIVTQLDIEGLTANMAKCVVRRKSLNYALRTNFVTPKNTKEPELFLLTTSLS